MQRDPYRTPGEVNRYVIEEVPMVISRAGKNLRVSALCNHWIAGSQLGMAGMDFWMHRKIAWLHLVVGLLLLTAGRWTLWYIKKNFMVPKDKVIDEY